MLARFAAVGAVISIFAVACGASSSDEDTGDSEGAASDLRSVDVIVSAKTGADYEARAYPVDDVDGNGRTELYKAPLFYIYVVGTDASGNKVRHEWKTPRYMPYNNPSGARHESSYKTVGFITAGLSSVPRFAVKQYKPEYEVHNRFSPFGGAIVVQGAFYIHAGPESAEDYGWGSAGCVEVIGNFDDFKKDILTLAVSSKAKGSAASLNAGLSEMIGARKLFVTYESAPRPNLKAALSRQVTVEEEVAMADQPSDPTDPGADPDPTGSTATALTTE